MHEEIKVWLEDIERAMEEIDDFYQILETSLNLRKI